MERARHPIHVKEKEKGRVKSGSTKLPWRVRAKPTLYFLFLLLLPFSFLSSPWVSVSRGLYFSLFNELNVQFSFSFCFSTFWLFDFGNPYFTVCKVISSNRHAARTVVNMWILQFFFGRRILQFDWQRDAVWSKFPRIDAVSGWWMSREAVNPIRTFLEKYFMRPMRQGSEKLVL